MRRVHKKLHREIARREDGAKEPAVPRLGHAERSLSYAWGSVYRSQDTRGKSAAGYSHGGRSAALG
jgi:hypothetical protein